MFASVLWCSLCSYLPAKSPPSIKVARALDGSIARQVGDDQQVNESRGPASELQSTAAAPASATPTIRQRVTCRGRPQTHRNDGTLPRALSLRGRNRAATEPRGNRLGCQGDCAGAGRPPAGRSGDGRTVLAGGAGLVESALRARYARGLSTRWRRKPRCTPMNHD